MTRLRCNGRARNLFAVLSIINSSHSFGLTSHNTLSQVSLFGGSGKLGLKRRVQSRSTSLIHDRLTEMTVLDQVQGPKTAERKYDLNSWKQGYQSAESEDQYVLEPSEGKIPSDIRGTLFKNGPGKFKVGEDLVMHPFDGDGMVTAVTFTEEGAYFRNRYVQTKGYKRELEAGKQLYRGFSNLPGGVLANAFRITRKNLANTNVLLWGGQLLALWEGGLPHRLDSKSLETFGETKLGESIDEKRPIFTAHPRIDTHGKRLVGFGNHNMRQTTYYEYNEKFALQQFRVLNDVKGFIHDFALTDKYAVFFSGPIALNPLPWVLGLDTMASALKWVGDKCGSKIYIVPRDPSKPLKVIDAPPRFCFHLANGYDDPNTGEVVFDMVECSSLALGTSDPSVAAWDAVEWEEMPQQKLQRYRIDVGSEEGSVVSTTTIYDKFVDFPSVNPKVYCKEHRYIWAMCGALDSPESCPGQGILKLDVQTGDRQQWLPEPHEFAGEPNFVPRADAPEDAPEDDGYIVSFLVNGRDHRTDMIILDAAKISEGPICRVPLKGFIPHLLHGSFAPDATYTIEQLEKSFSLNDLFNKKGWNVAKSEFSGLGLNSLMD